MPYNPIVLSKGRDPYSDWTEMQGARGQWASSMFQRMGRPTHLRGLHYFIVSQSPRPSWPDGTEYANTESHWEKLCAAAVWARYQDIGDWTNLIDRKHPDPIDAADYALFSAEPFFEASRFSTASLQATLLEGAPQFLTTGLQTYHLEVWVEKNSMNDALSPTMFRYGATLQPLVGESSLERVTGAIRRITQIDKPTRIFYISDFDPSGRQMPVSVARKLEFYARDMGLDIRLRPIALDSEQVVRFQLPGIPTKPSDSRAAGFIQQYGDRATELDALEALYPGELARIVADALSPYVDDEIQDAIRLINDTLRDQYSNLIDQHSAMLESLADQLDQGAAGIHEAAQTQGLLDDVECPTPEHEVVEDDAWLLDTLRPYNDQLDAYNSYRQGGDK